MRPFHRDHFENGHSFLCFILPSTRKKMHFIWVSKYLHESTIWVHYFSSPTGDGTAILRGHPSHEKVYPLAVQRKYLHFSAILRPWVLVRPRESISRPPALQSSAILTELILPRYAFGVLWHQPPKSQVMKTTPRVEIFENAGLSFTCGRKKIRLSNTMMSYIMYFARIYY